MSIDFGKFKKKPKERQEIAEEKVADKSNNLRFQISDKFLNPPKYKIVSDQLRANFMLLTGKRKKLRIIGFKCLSTSQ
jgi:hypothetical protein